LAARSLRPSRPRWRSAAKGDRRRTRLRAAALRRTAAVRLFLACARNGRSPGEKSLTAAVAAQAIEALAVLWPDQAIRGQWLAGPTVLRRRRGGYRTARTRGQARRAKDKKPWRTDGCPHHVRSGQQKGLHGDPVASEMPSVASKRCSERAVATRQRSKTGSVNY
jgi:hypothetical protein